MGEQSVTPNGNHLCNGAGNNQEGNDENDQNDSDAPSEEYEFLDNQLDALNSALDEIEQKNDDIHAQLLLLLQSNREIRLQMQQAVKGENVPESN